MGRIIKSGGLLILGDPTMPSIMIEVFNWALKWSSSGDVKLWKKREIRELFGRCGFVMEDWKRINYRCFVCSLRKNKGNLSGYYNQKILRCRRYKPHLD